MSRTDKEKVPDQLKACCSVTRAVTVLTLQEFAINPSSSTIKRHLKKINLYYYFCLHRPLLEWAHKENGKVRKKEKQIQTVWERPVGNQARFKALSFKCPSLSSHQGGSTEELGR